MISETLFQKIADLSMLEFTEEEQKEMMNELERMLKIMAPLTQFQSGGIVAETSGESAESVLRKDIITEHLSQEDAFKNTKDENSDSGFFKVPYSNTSIQ